MLIVQSTETAYCVWHWWGTESLMEMTCGILTYARAKDAIFVSGKKIVDMHRMPWNINKSALHTIYYNCCICILKAKCKRPFNCYICWFTSIFASLLQRQFFVSFGSRAIIYVYLLNSPLVTFPPVSITELHRQPTFDFIWLAFARTLFKHGKRQIFQNVSLWNARSFVCIVNQSSHCLVHP